MQQRAREVIRIGDGLFERKRPFDNLCQEIALNFYPERADFTSSRSAGDEISDHLFASYPVLARRELGNLLAANMRPRDRKWFELTVQDEDINNSDEARAFLDMMTETQWRAMYDRPAQFVRATKETDHDFITFGNGVIWYGLNVARDGLLFRNFHLRDNAWSENSEGKIDTNHRNWTPTARQLHHYFGDKVSRDVMKAVEKDPEKTFACRHVVLPSRLYELKSKGGKQYPFVSLYVERESETVLEQVGLNYFPYVVPRWQTMSNSPFGVSMATGILLPDGRTLQVVMRTLREAGESYVNPPMIAVSEAIRGDIALYPGGVTTADIEYDERLGEVLRPLSQDRGGYPIGENIAAALKEDLRHGFFLDKIQLPEVSRTMTAFEVRRRLEEHMRSSAPIFEPIIEDYSDPLCDGVFNLLMSNGAFPIDQMPESLSGQNVKFKFRSPLTDLADQADAEVYAETRDRILIPAAQIDPAQMQNIDFTEATRDAMRASGWKAKWMKPKEAVDEHRAQMEQQAQAQQMMQEIAAAGGIAKQAGDGIDAMRKATAEDPPPAQAAPARKPAMGARPR